MGASKCHKCLPGFYNDEEGLIRCKPCPVMMHQPQFGQTACLPCPPHSNLIVEAAVTCNHNCSSGKYSRDNKTCHSCLPGTFQKGSAAMHCLRCRLGYFQPLLGRRACIAAYPGSYVDTKGSTFIKKCPAGTANPQKAAISFYACKGCKAGSFAAVEGSDQCSVCQVSQ